MQTQRCPDTQTVTQIGKGEENLSFLGVRCCHLLTGRTMINTKGTAATNFQADQNKSENKTFLTAEKCGNVLRGNYSLSPCFTVFLLPRVQALNCSRHSRLRGTSRPAEGTAVGLDAPVSRPPGDPPSDGDIGPVPDAGRWGASAQPSPEAPCRPSMDSSPPVAPLA